jgi:hypothetical protein
MTNLSRSFSSQFNHDKKEEVIEPRKKTNLLWDLVLGLRAGKSKRRVNRHREWQRGKGQPPR